MPGAAHGAAAGDAGGGVLFTFIIRATIEVAADGDSFTATYTLEFIFPDGTSTGQAGPGTATGTRLALEPPGTPVTMFEELFGQFEGTPETSAAP